MHLIEGSGKVALVAAALLAFTLAGCGRKSSLDPPPTAAVQQGQAQPGQPPQPARVNPLGWLDADQDEGPVAPPGQKRRLIIDRILD